MARLQYIMITSRAGTYLSFYEGFLSKTRLPRLTEIVKMDEDDIDKQALTK